MAIKGWKFEELIKDIDEQPGKYVTLTRKQADHVRELITEGRVALSELEERETDICITQIGEELVALFRKALDGEVFADKIQSLLDGEKYEAETANGQTTSIRNPMATKTVA